MCLLPTPQHRRAFTLMEMLVVIVIIVVLAALAAGFMPRAQDSTKLSNAIDQIEQWLLTAKMRAKRDGLATGIRFITDSPTSGFYTQFQYVQQPDPLSGGQATGNGTFSGGYCMSATTTAAGTVVAFGNVDFSLGGLPQVNPLTGQLEWLVQPGDYLEVRDGGGVHPIIAIPSLAHVTVSSLQPITLTAPTANYRILRQPRPLVGENPLQLPGNMAVDLNFNPSTASLWSYVSPNVTSNVTGPIYDILFSPSGAVVGTNAGLSKIFLFIHDMTQNPIDTDRAGVVAIQTTTGYIGGYNAGPVNSPYLYANYARGSGL